MRLVNDSILSYLCEEGDVKEEDYLRRWRIFCDKRGGLSEVREEDCLR